MTKYTHSGFYTAEADEIFTSLFRLRGNWCSAAHSKKIRPKPLQPALYRSWSPQSCCIATQLSCEWPK